MEAMLWGVVADGWTGSVWKMGGLGVCPPLCSTRESRCFLGDPDTHALPAESSHSHLSLSIRGSELSGRASRLCPRAEGPLCVTPASCLAVGIPPAPPVVSGGVLTLGGSKERVGKKQRQRALYRRIPARPQGQNPGPAGREEAAHPGWGQPHAHPQAGLAALAQGLREAGSTSPGSLCLRHPTVDSRVRGGPAVLWGAVPSWGAQGGWSLKLADSLCLPFPVCLGGPAR